MTYSINSILRLISKIHSSTQDFLQHKLELCGLSKMASSHGNILFCLSQQKSMTFGEISEKINRDKSTTTVLLKKLEEENFIQIKKDENDSRKKNIELSEKGKKINLETEKISKEMYELALKNFSEKEKEELLILLTKVKNNLCEKEN